MTERPTKDSWTEWSQHVLKELERLNDQLEKLQDSSNNIHIELAMLKVKASAWGAVAGTIPILILYLSRFISK